MTIYGEKVEVLLVEDNRIDIKLIRKVLSGRVRPQFRVSVAETLKEATAEVQKKVFDVVLLDLNLIDSSGLDTLYAFRLQSPRIPIVVLTGINDRDFGIQAMASGAQDYLIKGQIDDELLARVLLYAIERNRINKCLIEDETKIRLFVKYSPVAIAIFDKSMRYIMTSQKWLDDYGFKEENIIGEYHYDILAGISEKWKSLHKKCLAGESIKSDEDLLIFPHERKEWIRWEMHPWRNSEGVIDGIIIFREVITKRKNAEEIMIQCRDNLEKIVEQRTSEIRDLYRHLEDVREQERTMIAREVHDELGQALTALKMDVAWLNRYRKDEQKNIEQKLEDMSTLISSTIKTIQKICSELRPGILDDLGLVAAIEWLSEDFQKRSEINCQANIDFNDNDLDPKYAITLFRIYQEALTNILRHAQATEVSVRLQQNDQNIVLKVQDNGIGIQPEELANLKSFGLMGMRERAQMIGGSLNIDGAPNLGTKVEVTIPLSIEQELTHA